MGEGGGLWDQVAAAGPGDGVAHSQIYARSPFGFAEVLFSLINPISFEANPARDFALQRQHATKRFVAKLRVHVAGMSTHWSN